MSFLSRYFASVLNISIKRLCAALSRGRWADLFVGTHQESSPSPTPFHYLILMGVSSLVFWLSRWVYVNLYSVTVSVITKFSTYVSVMVWINSVWYLNRFAVGVDVESFEFQKDQVRLSLFIVSILILMEFHFLVNQIVNPSALG